MTLVIDNRVREAFQSKKQRNLGIWHLGGGGSSKNQKSQLGPIGEMALFSYRP